MPNSKFEFCNCTSLIVTFRKIISTFTEKNWTLSFVKLTHKRTNVYGSATKCKTGSGRPITARTVDACMMELRNAVRRLRRVQRSQLFALFLAYYYQF